MKYAQHRKLQSTSHSRYRCQIALDSQAVEARVRLTVHYIIRSPYGETRTLSPVSLPEMNAASPPALDTSVNLVVSDDESAADAARYIRIASDLCASGDEAGHTSTGKTSAPTATGRQLRRTRILTATTRRHRPIHHHLGCVPRITVAIEDLPIMQDAFRAPLTPHLC